MEPPTDRLHGLHIKLDQEVNVRPYYGTHAVIWGTDSIIGHNAGRKVEPFYNDKGKVLIRNLDTGADNEFDDAQELASSGVPLYHKIAHFHDRAPPPNHPPAQSRNMFLGLQNVSTQNYIEFSVFLRISILHC